ncbi:uncharacterized protein LOC141606314 [Silene latifolia]|uniref:uncharacterized protein LOC141606314 n=1 Tax=Silene latifolia TaxID=37657 RepID=UPI003D786F8B
MAKTQQKNRQIFIEEEDEEIIQWEPKQKPIKKRIPQKVCLEGYVEASDDDVLPRTKSLTDDDLDELKGCVDLGFGFSYDEIPELCNTLPALELCYSMSQKFLDEHNHSDTASSSGSETSSPMPTWKISSPGDHPEDVKARLKFWAQAVACTVKLCSTN